MAYYLVDFTAEVISSTSFVGLVKANGFEEAKQKAFKLDMLDMEKIDVDMEEITEIDEVMGFRIHSLKGEDYGIHYRTDTAAKKQARRE